MKTSEILVLLKSLLLGFVLWSSAVSASGEGLNERLGNLVSAGAYAEALAVIAEARSQAGVDQAALDLLKGAVLVRMGRLDEGMVLFQELAAKQPNDAALFNNIGVIHAQKGEVELAREAFEQAVKISPDYLEALMNLGDVYAELACRSYGKIPQDVLKGRPAYCEPIARPAATTEAESTADQEPTNTAMHRQVLEAVRSWRSAWAAQDVVAYLDHYSARFKPEGMSLEQWQKKRERSLTRPKWIEIELANPLVQFLEGEARVQLNQSYRSDRYSDLVTKQLILVEEEGGWRIISERAR